MIKSLTNSVKNFFNREKSQEENVTYSKKRKRRHSGSDSSDDDCVVTLVKRPRTEATDTGIQNFFNTLIANPYQKMSEYFKNKKWADKYFFKPLEDKKSKFRPPHNHDNNSILSDGTGMRRPSYASVVKSSNEHNHSQGEIPGSTTGTSNTTGVAKSVAIQTERDSDQHSLHPHSKSSNSSNSSHSHRSLFSRKPQQRKFTVMECIRLDEKKKYEELIQRFTSVPISKSDHGISRSSASSPSISVNQESVLGSRTSADFFSNSQKPPSECSHSKFRVVPTSYNSHQKEESFQVQTDSDLKYKPLQTFSSQTRPHRKDDTLKVQTDHNKTSQSTVHFSRQTNGSILKPPGNSDVVCISDEEDVICINDNDVDISAISPAKGSNVSQNLTVQTRRSPDQTSFLSSPYLNEDWMAELDRKYCRTSRDAERKIEEAEIRKKFYADKHKQKYENLENEMLRRMKLYDAEPAVVAEIQVSSEEEEEEEEELPELTEEMQKIINSSLQPHPADEILVEGFKLQIRRQDMESLAGLNWLNDEIINFYMNLLVERGEREGKAKVYAFNTFFYPKVMSGGQQSVKRWTRRVDIFSHDYILIPVHLGMHWCLAVIDFKKKSIRYFDSMGGNNQGCLNALKEYLCAESLDKKKQEFDLTGWKTEIEKNIPKQMNGSDCGMFACKFAEYITREANITFSQQHMPYFRRRMVYEIVQKKLLQ